MNPQLLSPLSAVSSLGHHQCLQLSAAESEGSPPSHPSHVAQSPTKHTISDIHFSFHKANNCQKNQPTNKAAK